MFSSNADSHKPSDDIYYHLSQIPASYRSAQPIAMAQEQNGGHSTTTCVHGDVAVGLARALPGTIDVYLNLYIAILTEQQAIAKC